ncbi:DUF7269 family protein [Halobaculum limi]|uniref:DUF7269 family protein n=1 Tax=Halobaculum limi TaxID=3031916 RepID=UPI002407202E|nr:hypothetical protein [Halobaculum sp. YSMS11]
MRRLIRFLRDAALVVGVGGVAYGAATLVAPQTVPAVTVSTPLVASVGVAATLAGCVGVVRRATRPRPLPDRPGTDRYPAPGEEWATRLHSIRATDQEARRALREAVEAVAVERLVAAGHAPEDAQTTIRQGTWTDAPLAAAYLRGDPPTRVERLRAFLAGHAPWRRRVRRAMDAVADIDAGSDIDADAVADSGGDAE